MQPGFHQRFARVNVAANAFADSALGFEGDPRGFGFFFVARFERRL
jgi:hypothetical protein